MDLVVTTAQIPGKPAPRLITADMVRSMRAGSVIVDLAADSGGNCELSKPGETIQVNEVTIIAPTQPREHDLRSREPDVRTKHFRAR